MRMISLAKLYYVPFGRSLKVNWPYLSYLLIHFEIKKIKNVQLTDKIAHYKCGLLVISAILMDMIVFFVNFLINHSFLPVLNF